MHFAKSCRRYSFKALVALSLAVLTSVSVWATLPSGAASGDLPSLLEQGNRAMEQGRLEDASEWFEEALKLAPGNPGVHNQLGLCYSRRNMLLEAGGQFQKALAIDKNFLPSLNNLGSVMYRQSNYNSAIKYYKAALAIKANDPEILVNLASVYRDRATYIGGASRNDDYLEAVKLYEQSLASEPDFAPAHNNLGLCYLRLRRYAQAEQEIHKAISIKPSYAAAYFNLGLVYQAQRKVPEAIAAFQNSLQHETVAQYAEGTRRKIQELGMPESGEADHFSRGLELLAQKKWGDAEAQFKQTVAKQGQNPVAWNNLGYSQSRQEKHKSAIESYVKALTLLPEFPVCHYNLGQALFTLDDLTGAEKQYRIAADQAHGRYPLAHNALAIVLKQKGDLKSALAQYKLALMQSGDTLPVVHYNIAVLYEGQGNRTAARNEYKQYLLQSPSGLNAGRARERFTALTQ